MESTIWTPIKSYFHESLRGTTIIRAFDQENTVLSRKNELLDRLTTHWIAHHSCWCWFNTRMFAASKMISLLTIYIVFISKGVVNNVALVVLINWSMDMPWLMDRFA